MGNAKANNKYDLFKKKKWKKWKKMEKKIETKKMAENSKTKTMTEKGTHAHTHIFEN